MGPTDTPRHKRARPKRLVASIHDVSPRHEGQVDRLQGQFETLGINSVAMLVVPNFWGEAPIVRGSPFARRLRGWAEQGVEIFLHGSIHRDDVEHRSAIGRFKASRMTAGEGEFLGLEEREAAARIADGRSLLQDITGLPIAGFIAPAWLYGQGARAALAKARIGLAEDHWNVWDPTTGQVYSRSPVITWATRTRVREASSLLVAGCARTLPKPRVVRLAVHPNDTSSERTLRSIAWTADVLARTHRPSRYADLVWDAD